jgi:hypothetical protein
MRTLIVGRARTVRICGNTFRLLCLARRGHPACGICRNGRLPDSVVYCMCHLSLAFAINLQLTMQSAISCSLPSGAYLR